jgi:hypothetical protein
MKTIKLLIFFVILVKAIPDPELNPKPQVLTRIRIRQH